MGKGRMACMHQCSERLLPSISPFRLVPIRRKKRKYTKDAISPCLESFCCCETTCSNCHLLISLKAKLFTCTFLLCFFVYWLLCYTLQDDYKKQADLHFELCFFWHTFGNAVSVNTITITKKIKINQQKNSSRREIYIYNLQ